MRLSASAGSMACARALIMRATQFALRHESQKAYGVWLTSGTWSDTSGDKRHGRSIAAQAECDSGAETPPALSRVVLQFQPKENANVELRHHRLYAVWYFNFSLRRMRTWS